MFEAEQRAVEARINAFCTQNNLVEPHLFWSPIPFAGRWGIATSFFQMASQEAKSGQKVNVPERAQEIASQVAEYLGTPAGFDKVEAVRGYLNLYFSTGEYARHVTDTVITQGADFGRGEPKTERVMVEYAQPNTHHSVHIGHARNAILGEALARLVQFAGFDTIRASYPGDIGMSVITVVWAYLRFYQGQEPVGVHERGQWLAKIYVEATNLITPKENETPEETAQREAYDAERRELFKRWDIGDPVVREAWQRTRQWSLDELDEVLKLLDIKIDVWFYESQVDGMAKEIVEELVDKGIAEDDRPNGGPVIVKIDEKLGLTKEKYRSNILLRSDGTTLYLTKDLALARIKFEVYHVDRSIYVIDVRQSLHMQQTYKILEIWGFPQAAKCYHLGYGTVTLPEGAMSSRKGRVILFMDVMKEALKRVLDVISVKNPDLPEDVKPVVAEQVGMGALKYAMLAIDNNRDMVFEYDSALNFDGHTGPYIQYACVRCSSILKKAGLQTPPPAEASQFTYELDPKEIQLIDLMSRLPNDVQRAAADYKPLVIATLAYDLAKAFNDFYDTCPVIKAEPHIRDSRLRLVAAARQAISNALYILGITAPEAM